MKIVWNGIYYFILPFAGIAWVICEGTLTALEWARVKREQAGA